MWLKNLLKIKGRGMKRIYEIENCAFEIVKLLQHENKAFRSWAIGRAREVLEMGIKIKTIDDYWDVRKLRLKKN